MSMESEDSDNSENEPEQQEEQQEQQEEPEESVDEKIAKIMGEYMAPFGELLKEMQAANIMTSRIKNSENSESAEDILASVVIPK